MKILSAKFVNMGREFFPICFPLGPSIAGNIEKKFFCKMPADCGMAFILVSHFAPTYKSLMPDLLKKYTEMDVYHERSLFVSICCHSELGSESQKEDISVKRDAETSSA